MKQGFIYISSNKSHIGPLLKIGLTTRKPSERVKEFFSGKTSVPEEFNLDFSCSVYDCVMAESKIHIILDSYRHKHNREFFIIKKSVVKALIIDIFTEINQLYKAGPPTIDDYTTSSDIKISNRTQVPDGNIFYADPRRVLLATQPQSTLNRNQRLRVELLHSILSEAESETLDNFIKGFEMDLNPENEIKVYELIAKEYCKINDILKLKVNQLK